MRLTDRRMGPIADALPYIMRAANNLMLDRYRSARQRDLRDKAWGEASATHSPSSECALISREQLTLVEAAIAATGERPAQVFMRFLVDGVHQRDIAGAGPEEHTSELQSLLRISYTASCLKIKNTHDSTPLT